MHGSSLRRRAREPDAICPYTLVAARGVRQPAVRDRSHCAEAAGPSEDHVLAGYESSLAELGCKATLHYVDLTAEDLAGIMKPLEVRRFLREVAQMAEAKGIDASGATSR